MKKIYLLFIAFTLLGFSRNQSTVYVCKSKSAKRYHYTDDCRGLNACTHQIITTSAAEAQNMGLTLCHLE